MQKQVTFTIAIPVRNGSNYLRDAIRSALRQTRPADEILVVDDNSEDETAVIAKAKEWGNRVRYCFNPTPTGFADAWNRAAKMSTSDYVSILHHDDLLDPDYLSAIEAGLARFPQAHHAFTACRYIDAVGNVDLNRKAPGPHHGEPVLLSGRDYAHRYLLGVWNGRHIHRCPGVTTARSLLLERCAYRKEAGHIADDDFFYRVGVFTDVVGVSKPLACYREHESSATGSVKLLPMTLARDYLFQIGHRADRAGFFEASDEEVFEKLCVRQLDEALYWALRRQYAQWRDVLRLAMELDELVPGAMAKHLPVWQRPTWAAARGGHSGLAFVYVSFFAAYRSMKRRLSSLLKPGGKLT